MADAARRRATYADLVAVPDHLIAELVHGTLVTQSRPAGPHARAASVLGMELGGPFDRGRGGPGGWWIVYEPQLALGEDVLVPDVAGWRRERMPHFPEDPNFLVAPDWVCEVLSPSTARIDRVEKMAIYRVAGVAHVWLVDPLAETLEVYRREDAAWLLVSTFGGRDAVRAEPFDAIALELGALFDR